VEQLGGRPTFNAKKLLERNPLATVCDFMRVSSALVNMSKGNKKGTNEVRLAEVEQGSFTTKKIRKYTRNIAAAAAHRRESYDRMDPQHNFRRIYKGGIRITFLTTTGLSFDEVL